MYRISFWIYRGAKNYPAESDCYCFARNSAVDEAMTSIIHLIVAASYNHTLRIHLIVAASYARATLLLNNGELDAETSLSSSRRMI
jgi:hypothetical protein